MKYRVCLQLFSAFLVILIIPAYLYSKSITISNSIRFRERKEKAFKIVGGHTLQIGGKYTTTTETHLTQTHSGRLDVNQSAYISNDISTINPMNVLLILADDMRPQFGCTQDIAPFLKPNMATPNIDALARKSLFLTRTYTQFSLCGPSRAVLMTSRRPDVTQVYNNTAYWRDVGGNFTSMPQYFKEYGYHTVGAGKVFHMGVENDPGSLLNQDDAFAWSEPFMHPQAINKYNTLNYNWAKIPDYEILGDDVTAANAVEKLKELSQRNMASPPFFMAVGFHKPHIAHACPRRFFKQYHVESGQYLFNVSWQTPIYAGYQNMAPFLNNVSNEELGHIPDKVLRQIRMAYYACISYVDHLVGMVLRALEEEHLVRTTIVVFMSDHGYHLGDNYHYGKYTNHEMATHVPLMIHIPGRTDHGIKSETLAEVTDVFPTLVHACGITAVKSCPPNSVNIHSCTDGQSLIGLVDGMHASQKAAVYTQIDRGPSVRQYSVRTPSYRYMTQLALMGGQKWCKNNTKWKSDMDELYHLEHDPIESTNVVQDPEHSDLVVELRQKVHDYFNRHNCL